jgi:hypothetical protein
MGNEFEYRHLLVAEMIDDSFFPAPHLVNDGLEGDANSLPPGKTADYRVISFRIDKIVSGDERAPREAAFTQTMGQEAVPDFLTHDLTHYAFHPIKGKRGMILNQQNC